MQTAAANNAIFGQTRRDPIIAESNSPAYQAYQILHVVFVLTPLLAGIDKFTSWMTSWDGYVAPVISRALPFTNHQLMLGVGVVEVVAAVLVAAKPRFGSLVFAVWLLAVIVNLFVGEAHYDIALRDFALLLGALALNRLSIDFERAPDPMKAKVQPGSAA